MLIVCESDAELQQLRRQYRAIRAALGWAPVTIQVRSGSIDPALGGSVRSILPGLPR
jgi:hypothetical protein